MLAVSFALIRTLGHSLKFVQRSVYRLFIDYTLLTTVLHLSAVTHDHFIEVCPTTGSFGLWSREQMPPQHSGVIRTLGHSFALVRSFGHSLTSRPWSLSLVSCNKKKEIHFKSHLPFFESPELESGEMDRWEMKKVFNNFLKENPRYVTVQIFKITVQNTVL